MTEDDIRCPRSTLRATWRSIPAGCLAPAFAACFLNSAAAYAVGQTSERAAADECVSALRTAAKLVDFDTDRVRSALDSAGRGDCRFNGYHGDTKHGPWLDDSLDGRGAMATGEYAHGVRTGTWTIQWPGCVPGLEFFRRSQGMFRPDPEAFCSRRGSSPAFPEPITDDDDNRPLSHIEEGPYVNGKRHGDWMAEDVEYFLTGPSGGWRGRLILSAEGRFVEGQRHGFWRLTDFGRLTSLSASYINGEIQPPHGCDRWCLGNGRFADGGASYYWHGELIASWNARDETEREVAGDLSKFVVEQFGLTDAQMGVLREPDCGRPPLDDEWILNCAEWAADSQVLLLGSAEGVRWCSFDGADCSPDWSFEQLSERLGISVDETEQVVDVLACVGRTGC